MRSIISNERECFVCHTPLGLHKHHIFYGYNGNRDKSEKYGCWVYLCGKHHNLSNEGVHFDKRLDNMLKTMAQRKFNQVYKSVRFVDIFHRNYLEDEEDDTKTR